ncbi:MAG: PLP-dependent aminotransferase family protein [Gammaproteobacteria bacterium]|nr:PLP-dependent aminotransferase family protein [Gammaproteobacteria bacterium]
MTTAHKPLYEKVSDVVNSMIEDGRLSRGSKAPSLRKMSQQLKVSISTVTKAYMNLEDQGILHAKPQSGYFVQKCIKTEPDMPRWPAPAKTPKPIHSEKVLEGIFAAANQENFLSLGAAIPSAELMPSKALARATRQVLTRHPEDIVNYCFSPGLVELRRLIAYRTLEAGCQVSPDDVHITSGGMEAVILALSAVTQPGDIVAIESPTYFGLLQAIEHRGLLAVEIETDPVTGMNLDCLEETIRNENIKAVLTVPNFSNPTGSLMPEANKARLVDLLAQHNIPLMEDDIMGDLYFGENRPPLCKKFDKKGLVLTCSSFSKTTAPGFRVGWVLPGRFKESVLKTASALTQVTASITQLAIAELLRSGYYDRHLNRLRRAYQHQTEQVRMEVAAHFPEGTRISRPKGGFILWVQLPQRINSREMYQQAMEAGISLTPGDLFSVSRKYQNFIRLCAGYPMTEQVSQAIATLGRIAHNMLNK